MPSSIKKIKLTLIVLLIAFLVGGAYGLYVSRKPAVVWTMVNVNTTGLQGDANLIQVKGGKTILIDAGYRGPASSQLIPYLLKNNIKFIDVVFITHPHRDHYEGVGVMIKAGVKIGAIYSNIPDKEICDKEIPWGCNYKDIVQHHELFQQQGIPTYRGAQGQKFDLGNGVKLNILYAFNGVSTPVGETDVNDLSFIMMLKYKNHKIIFPGDVNQDIGGYLAEHANDISAELLKVPHHGTESVAPNSFFDRVKPQFAFVPAPTGLWCSKRSERIRDWFHKNAIPVYVNGYAGHVRVELNDTSVRVIADPFPYGYCKKVNRGLK
ncbi:MAG TPA: MBL fold metallo-hydrolase [Acidiferrobacteraceae bacterium]|nr:MBL fold metallo-hydrolase [Acidiferrobacteraceae bacterium]